MWLMFVLGCIVGILATFFSCFIAVRILISRAHGQHAEVTRDEP